VEVKNILPTRPYLPAEPIDTAHAVDALAALAQPTRLAVFRRLVEFAPEGLNAGAIGAALDLASPTLSFHLKELVHAGLVKDQREGRHIRYRADLAAMNALIGYLTDNCCRGQGRLADGTTCAPACAPVPCAPETPRVRNRR
jgi:DNA-binding transcriptional ArsR family regulator